MWFLISNNEIFLRQRIFWLAHNLGLWNTNYLWSISLHIIFRFLPICNCTLVFACQRWKFCACYSIISFSFTTVIFNNSILCLIVIFWILFKFLSCNPILAYLNPWLNLPVVIIMRSSRKGTFASIRGFSDIIDWVNFIDFMCFLRAIHYWRLLLGLASLGLNHWIGCRRWRLFIIDCCGLL